MVFELQRLMDFGACVGRVFCFVSFFVLFPSLLEGALNAFPSSIGIDNR